MAGKGIQIKYKPGGKKTISPFGFQGQSCYDATRPYEPNGAASQTEVSDQESTNIEVETNDAMSGADFYEQQNTQQG